MFFIKLIFKIFRCFTPLSEPNYCGIINWSQVVNVLVWNLRDGNNLLFSKDFLFFVSIIQSFMLNCYFAFLNINNLKSKKRKSKYLFHGWVFCEFGTMFICAIYICCGFILIIEEYLELGNFIWEFFTLHLIWLVISNFLLFSATIEWSPLQDVSYIVFHVFCIIDFRWDISRMNTFPNRFVSYCVFVYITKVSNISYQALDVSLYISKLTLLNFFRQGILDCFTSISIN